MERVDISYLVIPVDNADEALSLSNYLNEHGVCAGVTKDNEVNIPLEHGSESMATVELLKKTWRMFWNFSDSGLLGIQCYVK